MKILTNILIIIIIVAIITIIVGFGIGYYFSKRVTNPKVTGYEENYEKEKKNHPDVIETYEKLEKEEVSINSVYGYKLHGIFFPNKIVDRVVILSHGITANLWDMLKYGFLYIPRGFSILAYDHRYHGLSGGQNTSVGYYEKDDLKACVDWIRKKYGKETKIGLHGESMGSAIVVEYLGMYDDVQFAVDNCGFTSFVDEAKFVLKKYCNVKINIVQSFVIFFATIVTKIRCGWSFNEVVPLRSIKKTKTPMLFIHGGCDKVVPCEMCKAIFDAKKYGIKDKFEAKSASHT
ncbi:alpha/beta hydrolase, partial [Romboutsia sp.]|uniref:alpha/beta hydrolase n=1 Tax=Romboutsia sp. TaxID=1965302 RepID=UPI003F3D1817